MGSGGGQSGSSSTQATIAPELQPLFQNTANILLGLQSPQLRGTEFEGQQIPLTTPLDAFLGRNAQIIPQSTLGQQNILDRQRERAGLPALAAPPPVPPAQEPQGGGGAVPGKGGPGPAPGPAPGPVVGPGGPGATPGPAGPGVEVPPLPPLPPGVTLPPPVAPPRERLSSRERREKRQEREERAFRRQFRKQRQDDE